MNRKLPYEQLIADKMRELPVPDTELMWLKMKEKLEEEMPQGEEKKPGGGFKWRWLGIITALIFSGAGLYVLLSNPTELKTESLALKTVPSPITVAHDVNNDHPSPQSSVQSPNPPASQRSGDALVQHVSTDTEQESSSRLSAETSNNISTPDQKNEFRSRREYISAPPSFSPVKTRTQHPRYIREQAETSIPKSNFILTRKNEEAAFAAINPVLFRIDVPTDKKQANPDPNLRSPFQFNTAYQTITTSNSTLNTQHSVISIDNEQSAGLTVPSSVYQLPDVRAEKKKLLRDIKRHERKEERALAKSYKTYRSFWGEPTERWFAAGIAPYQNVAIAGQQSYHLNSSAGKNIITDYIPSPYLQLHVTNRIYLLSEFQFNSPQYTPSVLLSERKFTPPLANTDYTERIFLRKLYYFNMPVSFYYSPVNNFYVGSGIQFSSFSSGLANVEQRSAGNALIMSETYKLKDDSLSAKINSSEWRYLLDVNYYFNRFMAGFRYNQALNKFIDHPNSLPSDSRLRNQAFQFYIRYNLVVSGRKK